MDNETEVIREKMEDARTDLTDKLELLEKQVRDTVQDATVVPVDARHDGPVPPVPRLNERGGAGDTVLTDRGAGGRRDAGHAGEEVLVGPVPNIRAGHCGPRGAVPEFGQGLVVALAVEPVAHGGAGGGRDAGDAEEFRARARVRRDRPPGAVPGFHQGGVGRINEVDADGGASGR